MDRDAEWVLVLDDDAEDAFAVFRMLERLGLHATVVEDGPAALDLLVAEDYALALLDAAFLAEDGGILADIKQRPQLSRLPVVVLSRDHGPAVGQRYLELGADDYLCKPVTPRLLRARVDGVLAKPRAVVLGMENRGSDASPTRNVRAWVSPKCDP